MKGGGSPVLLGFDESKYQLGAYSGGGGFSFGIAKATEGVGYKDPAYDRHMASLLAEVRRNPNFVPGAYDYCRYDLGNSPESEADWLLAVVGDPRGKLLAPDIEVPGWNGPLTEWRARFLARLAQRCNGYQAPWYSFSDYINRHALNTAQTTWCWLAWPDSNGPLRSLLVPVRMQQFGLVSVPGVSGSVDANRFFGTVEQLKACTVGYSPQPVVPTSGGGSMGACVWCFDIGDTTHVFTLSKAGDLQWWRGKGGAGGQIHAGAQGWWNMGGTGVPGGIRDAAIWPSQGQIVIRAHFELPSQAFATSVQEKHHDDLLREAASAARKIHTARTLDPSGEPDGLALGLVLTPDAPTKDKAVALSWFQYDNAGPFRLPSLPGPKGDKGDAGVTKDEVGPLAVQALISELTK